MKFLIGKLQGLLKWFGGSILTALGVSFVTYKGFQWGLDSLKDYFSRSVDSLSADAYQLFMMAGGGYAAGIIFGAFAFNVTLSAASKLSFGKGGKK